MKKNSAFLDFNSSNNSTKQKFMNTTFRIRPQLQNLNYSSRLAPCKNNKFHKWLDHKNKSEFIPDSPDLINEAAISKNLDESTELNIEDKEKKETVGDNVVNNFYKHYKKLDKIIEKNLVSFTSSIILLLINLNLFFLKFDFIINLE